MAVTLLPVSSSGRKKWPSPPRSWHSRSSNTHDSWKWLCNPPPWTLSRVQTHSDKQRWSRKSSRLQTAVLIRDVTSLFCQSDLFVSQSWKKNVFSYVYYFRSFCLVCIFYLEYAKPKWKTSFLGGLGASIILLSTSKMSYKLKPWHLFPN